MDRFRSSEEATAAAAEADGVPAALYRFRTYGSYAGDRDAVQQLLAGRIRFALIDEFNDPFEGRPRATAAFSNAGEQRAAMERYLRQLHMDRGCSGGEASRRVAAFMAGKTQQQIVDEIGDIMLGAYRNDDLMVCCFMAEPAVIAPLTWAHYAHGHRGVCLHFDARRLPLSLAQRVEYADDYPAHVVPRTHQDAWEGVRVGLLRKSALWSYEHEFRLIRVVDAPGVAARLGVEWEGRTAISDPGIVTGITLGARMPAEIADELFEYTQRERPDIEIWQASLHRTRYQIERERIA